MENNINWGILGLGNVASGFADAFKSASNAVLKGISSKNSNKINLFREKYNIDQNYCFDDYDNLLKCDEVDIVYIALPNSMHEEWVTKCIENKKKILVEKPAFVNLLKLENIKKEIENKKIFFAEGFMYRYTPQITKVLDLLKNNSVGILKSMSTNFGVNLMTKKNFFGFKKNKKIDKQNRLFNKNLGGGVVLDLGCYTVSLSILIASTLSKIDFDNIKILDKKIDFGSTDVDIEARAKLVFENGFSSSVYTSFQKDLGTEAIITGTDGIMTIKDPWRSEPSMITLKGKVNEEFRIKTNDNIFSYEISAISKDILSGKIVPNYPGPGIEESVGLIKIMNKWLN